MKEEREMNPDGTTACGVFLPLPYDLGKDFPDKWHEDDSVPHFTLLYAGELSPCEFKTLVKVVRKLGRHIAPFGADVSNYGEFLNKEGQRIPHMKPSMGVSSRLARIHGLIRRAAEAKGLKIAHTYGPMDRPDIPYEMRYNPHATLDYLPAEGPAYNGPKPTGSWRVNELEVWGHEKTRVPLGRNRYDQPSGLRRDPLTIHYPMAVPDVIKESMAPDRTPLLAELRDSCLDCVRKHLGQAAALMDEVKQGYPHYRWLAVGHLGEAASEAIKEHPKLADEIREHRVNYMKSADYAVPIMELIEKADKLVAEQDEPHKDQLKGGLADKSQPEEFDPEQIKMGVKVEKEHTDDPAKAREIAMDHLKEDPKYYTKLKKIEPQHEAETSLKGWERHPVPGGGGSNASGEITNAGSLRYFERFLKGKDSPPGKKPKLERTALGD